MNTRANLKSLSKMEAMVESAGFLYLFFLIILLIMGCGLLWQWRERLKGCIVEKACSM